MSHGPIQLERPHTAVHPELGRSRDGKLSRPPTVACVIVIPISRDLAVLTRSRDIDIPSAINSLMSK